MSEIEKQFFEMFGIGRKEVILKTMNCACGCHDCKNCEKYKNKFSKIYPEITDRILLELICIANTSPFTTFGSRDIKNLKEEVLLVLCDCINYKDIKHQVRALFKESN